MCISRSCTKLSLPSSRVWAHLPGYQQRLAKICGHILASLYCSRKASTSKRQSVYVTSAPGSVDLKIGISNLAGANRFFSLLPLWPRHQHQWPVALLAGEYPSESLRTRSLFNTCITIPAFQENVGGCGQPGQSTIVTSSIMVYSSARGSLIPSPTSTSVSDSPCMENLGAPSSSVYSPCSSGEYISPESLHLSESITGAQQL